MKELSFTEIQTIFETLQFHYEKRSSNVITEWSFISTQVFWSFCEQGPLDALHLKFIQYVLHILNIYNNPMQYCCLYITKEKIEGDKIKVKLWVGFKHRATGG